ncbi:MAG: knotted carbamoyltransferase YgeW, partial [Oligoflexia bacterium]|nr:knotted carbamoyltransferase YgeW [Oligoflexia bacterium]
EKMKFTKNGEGLYMHCLPADSSGVSCPQGEVAASVFERYRVETYKEAGFKPFVIAAMILTSKYKHPQEVLNELMDKSVKRVRYV